MASGEDTSDIEKVIAWNSYLSDAKVCDATQMDGKLEYVKSTETALHVLEKLLERKVASVPVWDEKEGKLLGSVSLLDVVILVSGMVRGLGFVDKDKPVGQVRADEVMNLSFRNPWRVLTDQAPILLAMDIMGGREYVHRIAITYSPGMEDLKAMQEGKKATEPNIRGYLTQTSLARWLFGRAKSKLPDTALRVKVRDFVCSPIKEVTTIGTDQPLRKAFDRLWCERRTGVAVVDKDGALVGTISASDLKYLPVSKLEDVQALMKKPISEFLAQKKEARIQAAFFWADAGQFTCTLDDSLELLLDKLQLHRVHRLWLVDPNNKPIGVISLSDVICQLENSHGLVKI